MSNITVVGIGYEADQLTQRASVLLKRVPNVILHTARCGLTAWLEENGIAYASLDPLYEASDDFDAHASAACEAVLAAAQDGDVAYCVFDVRDESAVLLAEHGAAILPGPPVEGALLGHVRGEVSLVAASSWEDLVPDASRAILVRELDTRELASEVKLRLMEAYPDDAETMVLTGGGIARIPLYDLDRLSQYDHRTSALVKAIPDLNKRTSYTLADLVSLIRRDRTSYRRMEYDSLCELAARLAGGSTYAGDRGEYDIRDVITDACFKLMNL